MTSQTLSRLIITTAVVASLTVLLFSGPTTSAAKADKTAPTTPTNLVVHRNYGKHSYAEVESFNRQLG